MSAIKQQPTHYADPATIETPYSRAAAAWNDRIGSATKQARNWRIFALLAIVALFISTAAIAYMTTQLKIKPIIVRVNEQGAVINTAYAGIETYAPTTNDIRYFLSVVVKNTRQLLQDPVAMNRGWIDAYAYLAEPAQRQMSELARASGIEQEITKIKQKVPGRVSRTVDMVAFLPYTNDTYQLRWIEKTFSSKGQLLSRKNWSGNFTIAVEEPQDEKTAFANPRGLYITSFSISPDLQ